MRKASKQPMHVGLLVAGHTSIGRDMAFGLAAYCREHDPWDILIEAGYSEVALPHLLKVMAHTSPRALIGEFWWAEQFRTVRGCGFPVSEITGSWRSSAVPQVMPDHRAIGRLVARHLLERGLRQFAFFGRHHFSNMEREAGFGQALSEEGHSSKGYHDPKLRGRSQDPLDDRCRLSHWVRGMKKPMGLFCANDYLAKEALLACQDANIRVPEEVAIVGVGNDDLLCNLSAIPLSSVDLSAHRIGYVAGEVLDRIRRGRRIPRKPVLVEPSGIVTRQSSDILAAENKEAAAAIRFIQEHAHQPLQVQDVLREIPISRSAMENHFRTLVGRTPREQILHARVERAKRLLDETILPLSAVAEKSGFAWQSNLSAVFKRLTGLSPVEYRQRRHRSRWDREGQ